MWSERYDREMKDVFEVQDEIARKIAEALRVTLVAAGTGSAGGEADGKSAGVRSVFARQEICAAADAAGSGICAADVRERGGHGPEFCAGVCGVRECLRDVFLQLQPRVRCGWNARAEASGKAVALRWDLPEVQVSQAWVLYATELHDEAVRMVRKAIERKRDCEGAYYLLCRALFSAGRYQEVVDVMDIALEASGEDYNVYVPIMNALGALGKAGAAKEYVAAAHGGAGESFEAGAGGCAGADSAGGDYAKLGRVDDAMRETNLAITLRANEASILVQRGLHVLRC